MSLIFQAGLRGILGSTNKHNTLEILKDSDGNYHLVIQETGGDMGNMRSGGVRVESGGGDFTQKQTYDHVKNLIDHIHTMHAKHPKHPAYVVSKE
jgi:hypothetical protein